MDDWIQILLRSVGMLFLILAVIRILGKRHPAKSSLHFVVYAVVAIIASLISLGIINNIVFGIIALAVWVAIPIALDYLAVKSKVIHDLIHGRATVLIKRGKIMEENLMQVRFTGEELLRDLRSKNVYNLGDVEFAVMETTGDINVVLKSDKKPVTAHDLGVSVAPQTEPQTVILDGNILDEPLSNMGLNRRWLKEQLEAMGISADNVFIGQVDGAGDLYIDLFDDAIQTPQPKVKELLYAKLEKAYADLLAFALETKNEEAREMYNKNAQRLKEITNKIEPYLLR
ncbi:MAG: DUF421 domain-containing protein [Mahellales bacterium]|jgi:uncharacterized membrane protein YcaP (DUF421 family)